MSDLVMVLRDYQRWMTDNIGEPSISIDDINGDETFGAAADRIEALEAVATSAKALVTRDDFWSQDFATPGEFDDVVDALNDLAIPRYVKGE